MNNYSNETYRCRNCQKRKRERETGERILEIGLYIMNSAIIRMSKPKYRILDTNINHNYHITKTIFLDLVIT